MEDKEKEAQKEEVKKAGKVETVTKFVKTHPKKIAAIAAVGLSFMPQDSRDLVSALLLALLGQ
jgi:hypothetical protein